MTQIKIAIRADAAQQIGTGHVMRCLALADELRTRGASVRFVCRQLPENLATLIRAHGHTLSMLPPVKAGMAEHVHNDPAHAHWLGAAWEKDAQDTLASLADTAGWDWIVVDHYGVDERWEKMLRRALDSKIMVIDDLADRKHDCDVLLDQNFYADMETRYTAKVPTYCQLLLGPRYALLRDEFRQLRDHVKPREGGLKRILIFFGGMDAGNYTARAVEALANMDSHDLHVDVVIGAQHTHREQIESACVEYGFVCHVQTNRMAELMAEADASIGAGGSASLERCCLGLPALIFAVAKNQELASRDLANRGAAYLGEIEMFVAEIERALALFLVPARLHEMSVKAAEIVDGQGAIRLSDTLFRGMGK